MGRSGHTPHNNSKLGNLLLSLLRTPKIHVFQYLTGDARRMRRRLKKNSKEFCKTAFYSDNVNQAQLIQRKPKAIYDLTNGGFPL